MPDKNLRSWKAENQVNVMQYVMEKSATGNGFIRMATVIATGTSGSTVTYSLADNSVETAVCFYRIKITDRDGRYNYSAVMKAERNPSQASAFILIQCRTTACNCN